MTKDEAKTKWCPQSLTDVGHPHGMCIASACMAWRWDWDDTKVQRITKKPQQTYYTTKGNTLLDGEKVETVCRTGRCGLSGPHFFRD